MDHVDRPAVGFAGLESGSFLILPPMTSLLAFCENVGDEISRKNLQVGSLKRLSRSGNYLIRV